MFFVEECSRSYFNGFQEISNYKQNSGMKNFFAILKIASYATLIIPLIFAFALALSCIARRWCKNSSPGELDRRVAANRLFQA